MKLEDKELDAALKQEDCPEDLVLWVLEQGSLSQQVLFLFETSRSAEICERFRSSKYPGLIAELLERDEASYLAWASEIGFEVPNFSEMDADEAALGMRWQIDNWVDNEAFELNSLYDVLVPREGSADTLQGELVRAISRIQSEHARNAMTNWGDGYYEQLTELIQVTLTRDEMFTPWVKQVIASDVDQIVQSGIRGQDIASGKKTYKSAFHPNFLVACDVEKAHQRLCVAICAWCKRRSTPIAYSSPQMVTTNVKGHDF